MKRILVAGIAIVVASCVLPTGGCACSPPPPGTIAVFGMVTRAEAPVAGAEVRLTSRQPRCDNDEVPLGGVATTDEEGRYAYVVHGTADSVCLRVVARGPAAASGDSAVAYPVRLRLLAGNPSSPPADSVELDLALPAAP